MQALWMLLAAALLASMSVCVKFASAYFHASELVFFRGLISLGLVAAWGFDEHHDFRGAHGSFSAGARG